MISKRDFLKGIVKAAIGSAAVVAFIATKPIAAIKIGWEIRPWKKQTQPMILPTGDDDTGFGRSQDTISLIVGGSDEQHN